MLALYYSSTGLIQFFCWLVLDEFGNWNVLVWLPINGSNRVLRVFYYAGEEWFKEEEHVFGNLYVYFNFLSFDILYG